MIDGSTIIDSQSSESINDDEELSTLTIDIKPYLKLLSSNSSVLTDRKIKVIKTFAIEMKKALSFLSLLKEESEKQFIIKKEESIDCYKYWLKSGSKELIKVKKEIVSIISKMESESIDQLKQGCRRKGLSVYIHVGRKVKELKEKQTLDDPLTFAKQLAKLGLEKKARNFAKTYLDDKKRLRVKKEIAQYLICHGQLKKVIKMVQKMGNDSDREELLLFVTSLLYKNGQALVASGIIENLVGDD